jgi:pimeloyl-ACP methyl ester carboxylesterase
MVDKKKDDCYPTAYKDAFHPFKSAEAKIEYVGHYKELEKTWPVDFESTMVDTSYGSTYVRICGPENAPVLVLLPGDTENSLSWKFEIEALSKKYRTYLPDQINDYGLSKRSRPIGNKQAFIGWLNELFTHLNLSKINLVGFSYGGGLALVYALAHPERINKLILLAPACRSFPIKLRTLLAIIFQDKVRTRNTVTNYLYWERADAVKKNELTHKFVDDMIDDLMLCRKCFTPHKWIMPFPIKETDWQKLGMPTLFMVGENDILVSAPRVVPFLNKTAPKIKTIVIPGAGHDLLIVKPEILTDEIVRFLQS